ncbi:MAG: hypothetical protein IT302_08460 [Dehalococcoidia bacterium]|nr:hypothetical protein [Dehalococcoidia bacterium]
MSTIPHEPDAAVFDAAIAILRSCGLNAGWQQTGGNALCIVVAEADGDLDEPRFWFGTGAERWAAEIDGEPMGLWTDVASDEGNPTQIARGILAALTRFAQNQS